MSRISKKLFLFFMLLILISVSGYIFAQEQNSSDKLIAQQLKLLLAAEKDIPNAQIDIFVEKGVVSLNGVVDTRLQENRIIEIAASIENVKDVDNQYLNVRNSSGFFADSLITAKVKGRIKYLSLNKRIKEGYNLHVETTDKVVHIYGNVVSSKDIQLIRNAASNIVNVKKVKMNIKSK